MRDQYLLEKKTLNRVVFNPFLNQNRLLRWHRPCKNILPDFLKRKARMNQLHVIAILHIFLELKLYSKLFPKALRHWDDTSKKKLNTYQNSKLLYLSKYITRYCDFSRENSSIRTQPTTIWISSSKNKREKQVGWARLLRRHTCVFKLLHECPRDRARCLAIARRQSATPRCLVYPVVKRLVALSGAGGLDRLVIMIRYS